MVKRCYTLLTCTTMFASQSLLIIAFATIPKFKVHSPCLLIPLLCVDGWTNLNSNFLVLSFISLVSIKRWDPFRRQSLQMNDLLWKSWISVRMSVRPLFNCLFVIPLSPCILLILSRLLLFELFLIYFRDETFTSIVSNYLVAPWLCRVADTYWIIY